jgi:hypothetical protein
MFAGYCPAMGAYRVQECVETTGGLWDLGDDIEAAIANEPLGRILK